MLTPWKKNYNQPRQHIIKQRRHFTNKVRVVKAVVFPVYVRLWELDHKEGWVLKNWCFQIVVLDKTLENPLDSREIRPVNSKGSQSWIFTRRTDAEAEAATLGPPDGKNWLIGKDPDARKDYGQEEKGTTEGKIVGWRHWLDGHEFEQAPGDGKDGESWHAAVHAVANSQMWVNDWTT